MRIAVFSDIHGNLPALEEVLAHIEKQKVDALFCLGDLVGYGPYPNEVIEAITGRKIPTIMGNYDDGVGYDRDDCGCAYRGRREQELGDRSLLWTRQKTSEENKEILRALRPHIRVQVADLAILLVHGSPRRINEYLYEDRLERTMRRILDAAEADILICGHTHLPYHRILEGYHIINDGSVGKPIDGDPRACYALVEITPQGPEVVFNRLAYDVERVARAIEASALPPEFAYYLRVGGSE